ncbi:MAG: SRPBCC domain-containing protein [Vulcanimicrobiota bacterium]
MLNRLLVILLFSTPLAWCEAREVSEQIPASRAAVWKALTSTEGVLQWQVALADLRLEPGAIWRTRYKADGVLGDEGTIENRLLTFDPERMYSIQIARPPKGFPFMNIYREMWTVVYLEELDPQLTRVTARSLGLPDSQEGRAMGDFFEKGNRYTLAELKKYFTRPTTD